MQETDTTHLIALASHSLRQVADNIEGHDEIARKVVGGLALLHASATHWGDLLAATRAGDVEPVELDRLCRDFRAVLEQQLAIHGRKVANPTPLN